MFDDDDGIFDHALEFGVGYGLYRHGQDAQTAQLINALGRRDVDDEPRSIDVTVRVTDDDQPTDRVAANFLDFTTADMPTDWEDYIGQGPLKQQVAIKLAATKMRGERFPHTLFASGYPGVGKTTAARLVAQSLGLKIIELVPPFNVYALVNAVMQLDDGDICFIDEIHKLAERGKAGAEFLLKVLEDGVAHLPDGSVVKLPNVTYIGATTDRDMLPDPVLDRFKFDPYFQPYTIEELARIAIQFAYRHKAQERVDPMMAAHIAMACRGIPRIVEKMIEAAHDLGDVFQLKEGRNATPQEVLAYLEVEPDGLTRAHIQYLTSLYQFYGRETKDGDMEFVAGQATMMNLLRETKQGIARIERFLVERGLVNQSPRGRMLTPLGIERSADFVARGLGASHAA